ncbi:integrating conjugative element protein pill, pfgi-1 [Dickeya dianthicola]|uniref:PFGI-1 class ICE element type IV pilus protein PilL2 n=1 Tax=Dickeya dianthicola TaxID=204039 RepID=UPI00136DAD6B|nr:PilL N-terminal domain-containing protein [Dickeya dianthicola]MCI4239515.1 PilL N-terminal domain-containing protein [Dickeya dianthicola]MCI4257401.1 PilL N-terminal domain-containing protein [Dickeya dianthicola]MZG24314.1 integrating conjugative element protein pill, pfgi-1 [Dickeya dianthicola]MZI91437.1 integrating conjugative element protein pill, pfgi-1 [Dickeya dianthicola]
MSTTHLIRRLCVSSLLVTTILINGCATTSVPATTSHTTAVIPPTEHATPDFIPVVRYGRYTLVELTPKAAQRDLLLQVIDVSMPGNSHATVGDGLRHALKRSGYQLCETAHSVSELYSLPLPAAHLHLGPMTLREALLTLAGPFWTLYVDNRTRQVCFKRPDIDAGNGSTLVAGAVKPLPPAGEQP